MKVAIIDDAQLNVTLIKHLVLKLQDTEPFCFTDPVLALEWCVKNDPDLIIVDYMMPEMSGTEFSQQLRIHYADTPILMVTANHEIALRHEALQLGVTDFLNKPINNTEFLARAKNMLAMSRSHKHLASEVTKATRKLIDQEKETIFCLARAAEYRDPETGAHILRMAHYSKIIAKQLGLSEEDQELLLQTAPMHDIGKVGTPDMILLKPGKLAPTEFAIMQQHAVIGYQILNASSAPLLKTAALIAHSHHEKYDGSGYPQGLKGDAIPLFGRIVALADVFDALTSERPYKKAWPVDQALELIKESANKHFDPKCVEAFFSDMPSILAIKNHFTDEDIDLRDRTLE